MHTSWPSLAIRVHAPVPPFLPAQGKHLHTHSPKHMGGSRWAAQHRRLHPCATQMHSAADNETPSLLASLHIVRSLAWAAPPGPHAAPPAAGANTAPRRLRPGRATAGSAGGGAERGRCAPHLPDRGLEAPAARNHCAHAQGTESKHAWAQSQTVCRSVCKGRRRHLRSTHLLRTQTGPNSAIASSSMVSHSCKEVRHSQRGHVGWKMDANGKMGANGALKLDCNQQATALQQHCSYL